MNGVCEQSATSGLMVKWILCIPGAGVESLAHKADSKHIAAMLDWVEAGLWSWS